MNDVPASVIKKNKKEKAKRKGKINQYVWMSMLKLRGSKDLRLFVARREQHILLVKKKMYIIKRTMNSKREIKIYSHDLHAQIFYNLMYRISTES